MAQAQYWLILEHKENISNFHKAKILQTILSNHNVIKVDIINKTKIENALQFEIKKTFY